MIPEGLVLLTSVVLAVSVIRLSRHKTLVQELYCIETLARVDMLCLDKTGTITEGTLQFERMVPFGKITPEQVRTALGALTCSLRDNNPTMDALRENSTPRPAGPVPKASPSPPRTNGAAPRSTKSAPSSWGPPKS